MNSGFSRCCLRVTSLLTFLLLSIFAFAAQREEVIIRSSGSREALRQKVKAVGGSIRQDFQNVNAVSAVIPASAVSSLTASPEFKVRKTTSMRLPAPHDPKGLSKGIVKVKTAGRIKFDRDTLVKNAQTHPADFLFNNALINATSLQAQGKLGDGIIVAVIDSGVANNPDVVPTLDGTVIGGESLVPPDVDPVTSATSTKNGDHGTWVGTMIAGHAAFVAPNDDCLVQSLQNNSPDSVIDATPFGLPGNSLIPVVGVAPAAKIYALKVFPSNAESTPSDVVLAAMDRVLTIKKNFLAGKPSVPVSGSGTEDDPFVFDSLNIQVLNMSVGGPTPIAGRDLEDLLTIEMLKVGITLATSSGNAGPAGLTTGSPSTGIGAISSGAGNDPIHERIVWDVTGADTCALGLGLVARPNNTIQTAYFSSRGPTADGRIGVDVVSAGLWNFVEGANGDLAFVAGTSFASPTVAGAAALLQGAVPKAEATQIRNAILLGANPKLLHDKSTVFDAGHGYLDVANALKVLKCGHVSNELPSFPRHSEWVGDNLHALGLRTYYLSPEHPLKINFSNMIPGERQQVIVKIGKNVGQLQVNLNSVTPRLPPDKQNQVFGDDILLAVHQAKTSAFGEGDYPIYAFLAAPKQYVIDNPEPGFMRVTVSGDWSNAGKVSARLSLKATQKPAPVFFQAGGVHQGDLLPYTFDVAPGIQQASFELTWNHDWTHYPTNDLDLWVVDPDGKVLLDGLTFNGRETVVVDNPKPGTWQILVDGFEVFGRIHNDGSEDGPKKDWFNVRVFTK